jgi:hypothetical protein
VRATASPAQLRRGGFYLNCAANFASTGQKIKSCMSK